MLLNRKGTASVLISGAMALTLVAAAGDTGTAAAGTASSSLNAVTLTVSGIDGVPGVSLLDVATLATTDPDAPGNLLGGPFASALVAPATIGGQSQGAFEARSDQTAEGATQGVDLSAAGIGVVAPPVNVAASATADTARAAVGAASAELTALTDLLGISINSAGVESVVTPDAASNTQGISVSGLDIALGDLLPAELLAQLPIDVLLDLLAQLPVGAPDVQGVVDAATALVGDVQTAVNDVVATAEGINDGIAALEQSIADLASQEALVAALQVDVDAAQTAADNAVANLAAAVAAAADVENSVEGLACVADNLLDPVAAAACIDALQADADAAVATAEQAVTDTTATLDQLTAELADATALLGPLAAAVDTLTDVVNGLVATLTTLLGNLLDTLNDLLAALTDLSNSLGDVIDGLLDTTLLGLGSLDLSMSAIATADPATSSSGVTCALSDLVVAGINLGGGSCTGDSLTGSLLGAVSTLETALGALPLADNLVPTITVDMMQISSAVTEADGIVTSRASVIPLAIDLPSLDLDPASLVEGLLAELSTDLIDGLLAQLPVPADLSGLGLDDAAATITGLLGTEVPELQAVDALVGDVVALLPDGLGLLAVSTPGVNLTIDPTSTASFSPGTPAAPAPAPDPVEPLPATGGGAIALAALGLGGAWSLRRRR